jgi:hypothetical protein
MAVSMRFIVRVQVAIFVTISQFIAGVFVAAVADLLPWLAGIPKVTLGLGLVAGAYAAARLASKIWRAAGQCSPAVTAIAGPTGFLLAVAAISTLKARGLFEPDQVIEPSIVLSSSFFFALLGTLWSRRQQAQDGVDR